MLHSRVERLDRDEGGIDRLQMAHAVAGRPVMWVSVYRVGDVLIDSGCAWGRPILERYLREHPVSTVLTTHEHEDHVGNHEVIEADVYAPRRAAELLSEGPPRLPPYRWVAWGAHGRAPHVRALPERLAPHGRAFRIMPTPGHSSDHVVYLDEASGALFTGDAYLGRLRTVRAKENVGQQMESLRRLAETDANVLYPAHGLVLRRPREKLLETVEHFERLAEKARSLADRGLSSRRIRQELLGPEPTITYISLGAFSSENLIRALLAWRA